MEVELRVADHKAECPVCGHTGFNALSETPLPSDELECAACGTKTLCRVLVAPASEAKPA